MRVASGARRLDGAEVHDVEVFNACSRVRRSLAVARIPGSGPWTGCALETESTEPDAPVVLTQEVLDQEALEGALINQHELEAQGYALDGRLWYSPNSHVAFYRDSEGRVLQTETARAVEGNIGKAEDWRPTPDQTFADYLETVGTYEMLTSAAAGPVDAIAFAAEQSQPGVRTEALDNQNCPKTDFDASCANPTHFGSVDFWLQPHRDVQQAVWNLTDQGTKALTKRGRAPTARPSSAPTRAPPRSSSPSPTRPSGRRPARRTSRFSRASGNASLTTAESISTIVA